MQTGSLYRLSAFTSDPNGGNPAGVWIGAQLPPPEQMQAIAFEVGYSETAFIAPAHGLNRIIRYYSPQAEVSFCGHATIATGVALGELSGDGNYLLSTAVGEVPVKVSSNTGLRKASLTSVEPQQSILSLSLVSEALSALGWTNEDLDPGIAPARAYAGAWHLILAVRSRKILSMLNYNFEALKKLMLEDGLTTMQLIFRESPLLFHSRNPFPVGGVVEDPATGASAAALGGYLRVAKLIPFPCNLEIHQGDDMGRPSKIEVFVPTSGGIVVSGNAVKIP